MSCIKTHHFCCVELPARLSTQTSSHEDFSLNTWLLEEVNHAIIGQWRLNSHVHMLHTFYLSNPGNSRVDQWLGKARASHLSKEIINFLTVTWYERKKPFISTSGNNLWSVCHSKLMCCNKTQHICYAELPQRVLQPLTRTWLFQMQVISYIVAPPTNITW